jgi:hypothetical protein
MNTHFQASPLKPDPQAMRAALKVFGVGPDHVTELRVLKAREALTSRFNFTFGGYFDDTEKLVKAACSIQFAYGWYIIPNPCQPDVLSRFNNRGVRLDKGESTQDHEILRRAWLLIDADPVRLARISSTDEEHELALARVREIAVYLQSDGWPAPVIADSGNGGHLLLPIDLPTDDGGLVSRCLKSLAAKFDDDRVKIDTSVANPARIWKLYGTPACKGDSTPQRPHRMARLLEVPDDL